MKSNSILIFGLSLIAVTNLFSQQRETVYATLTPTPLTTTQNNVKYLIQNNIGQTFHTVTVTTTGTTCNPNVGFSLGYAIVGEIDASFDGLSYFILPEKITSTYDLVNSSQTKLYRASTAYPFVRFNLINFNPLNLPSNCGVNIFYAGSVNGTTINDSLYNNGFSALAEVTPQSITTGCSSVISPNGYPNSLEIGLVGITVSNPNATASTITFWGNSSANTCTTTSSYAISVPANSSIVIPPDSFLNPLLVSAGISGIYAKSSAGTLTVNPTFAFEN